MALSVFGIFGIMRLKKGENMTTKENKKGAVSALFLAIALFAAGCAGYFYYGIGGTGFFTMVVAVICAVFCVKKIGSRQVKSF